MVSVQMPVFFLNLYFGSAITGFFSLMKWVLDAPVTLISSSVLEIFRQQASDQLLKVGNCRQLFIATTKRLLYLSILPFLAVFIFSPYFFQKYFRDSWYVAGEYARIFSLYYFFKFITSPLTYIFYLVQKQKLDFIFQCYSFVSSLF